MTALEQLNPPAPETTSEQDFRARCNYFFEENIGDMAFALTIAKQLVEELTALVPPESMTEKLAKDTRHLETYTARARTMLEAEDFDAAMGPTGGWLKEGLSESHGGDCTAVPATCIRCAAEGYYGLPSSKTWRGKAEGWALYNKALAELKAAD